MSDAQDAHRQASGIKDCNARVKADQAIFDKRVAMKALVLACVCNAERLIRIRDDIAAQGG